MPLWDGDGAVDLELVEADDDAAEEEEADDDNDEDALDALDEGIGGNDSETLGLATLQNCCARPSLSDNWSAHCCETQPVKSCTKEVAFPQKQSTSAMLLQPTCEMERSRQLDTQGEYPLRLGSCAELVGVALEVDAFAERLLAAVRDAVDVTDALPLVDADDVCDWARAAEVAQQRTRRGSGRSCIVAAARRKALGGMCGARRKRADSPELCRARCRTTDDRIREGV